jgi:predicted DCC family thiol-disulfide oxidoreductase YuxK
MGSRMTLPSDDANLYRVWYDALCPICRRSVRWLRRLDWRRRLEYRDIHDRAMMAGQLPDVSYAQAMKELLVVTPDGQRRTGFDGLRRLAWVLPAMWPVAPLLYVPPLPWLGRRMYRWIARRRYRLLACDGGICALHLRLLQNENLSDEQIATIIEQIKARKPLPTG